MEKTVYIKARPPGFKLHSYYTDLLGYPIPGWRALTRESTSRPGLGVVRQVHVALHKSAVFWGLSNRILPIVQTMLVPRPNGKDQLERSANITYCSNHLQTKASKWVADCEHIASLTGYYDPGSMSRRLGYRLQHRSCKGFFCWSERALENSRRVLGTVFPQEKCRVVYPAASSTVNDKPPRSLEGTIRVCHMTTHRSSHLENISNFYVKGTRDLLLLMKLASRTIPQLARRISFVIRAWCPPSYISKLRSMGLSIEVIEHPLSRVDALSTLAKSDLILMPCHSTPTMALIEAASRGVPVITNDVWANSEYVAEGQAGFLVKPPKSVRYQDERLTPLWYRPGFIQSLRSSMDTEYLNRHLRSLEYLAEDENVLIALQKKTSDHFIGSPFDVNERNRRIGTLLDQANS